MMNSNMNGSDDVNKKTIMSLQKDAYRDLLDAAINALEKGEMTVEEFDKSSQTIVRNLDGLESNNELILFLRDLAAKYSAYQKIYITYKQNQVAAKDQVKLEELQAKLQRLTSITT